MVTVTRVPTVGAERQMEAYVSRHRRVHLGMSWFAWRGSPTLIENKDFNRASIFELLLR